MNLSKLSTSDLLAIQAGDLSKVSTEGLYLLSGQQRPPSTERTWGEAVSDVPAILGKAVGTTMQIPGQLSRLISGRKEAGPVQELGRSVEEYWKARQSKGLQGREQLQQQAIDKAEQERGTLGALTTAFTSTVTDPVLLSKTLIEQIPLMLGTGVVGGAVQAGVKTILARTAVEGVTQAAVSSGAGVAVNVGLNAVAQGVDIGSDTYEEAYKKLLPQVGEAKAHEQALRLGREAAFRAGTLSAAVQKLPGGSRLERAVLGEKSGEGMFKGALKTGIGESLGEGVEEGGGRFIKNVGMSEVDPTQRLMQGVGGAAGLGAAGGFGAGTIAGGIAGRGEAQAAVQQRQLEDTNLYNQAATLAQVRQEIEAAEAAKAAQQPVAAPTAAPFNPPVGPAFTTTLTPTTPTAAKIAARQAEAQSPDPAIQARAVPLDIPEGYEELFKAEVDQRINAGIPVEQARRGAHAVALQQAQFDAQYTQENVDATTRAPSNAAPNAGGVNAGNAVPVSESAAAGQPTVVDEGGGLGGGVEPAAGTAAGEAGVNGALAPTEPDPNLIRRAWGLVDTFAIRPDDKQAHTALQTMLVQLGVLDKNNKAQRDAVYQTVGGLEKSTGDTEVWERNTRKLIKLLDDALVAKGYARPTVSSTETAAPAAPAQIQTQIVNLNQRNAAIETEREALLVNGEFRPQEGTPERQRYDALLEEKVNNSDRIEELKVEYDRAVDAEKLAAATTKTAAPAAPVAPVAPAATTETATAATTETATTATAPVATTETATTATAPATEETEAPKVEPKIVAAANPLFAKVKQISEQRKKDAEKASKKNKDEEPIRPNLLVAAVWADSKVKTGVPVGIVSTSKPEVREDGRTYLKVRRKGQNFMVPADELHITAGELEVTDEVATAETQSDLKELEQAAKLFDVTTDKAFRKTLILYFTDASTEEYRTTKTENGKKVDISKPTVAAKYAQSVLNKKKNKITAEEKNAALVKLASLAQAEKNLTKRDVAADDAKNTVEAYEEAELQDEAENAAIRAVVTGKTEERPTWVPTYSEAEAFDLATVKREIRERALAEFKAKPEEEQFAAKVASKLRKSKSVGVLEDENATLAQANAQKRLDTIKGVVRHIVKNRPKVIYKAPTNVSFKTYEDAKNLLTEYAKEAGVENPRYDANDLRELSRLMKEGEVVAAHQLVFDMVLQARSRRIAKASAKAYDNFARSSMGLAKGASAGKAAAKKLNALVEGYIDEIAESEGVDISAQKAAEGRTQSLTGALEQNFADLDSSGNGDHPYELSHTPVGERLPAAAVAAVMTGDLKAAIEAVAKNGSTPLVRTWARKILPALQGTKLEMSDQTDGRPGLYLPNSDTILINPRGMHEHTLLHEALHAAVSHVLENANHPLTKELTKLYEDSKAVLKGEYAVKDVHEFVSEAWSNPEVSAKLQAATSFWSRLYQAIRKFLGMAPTGKVNDAISKLLEIAPGVSRMGEAPVKEYGLGEAAAHMAEGERLYSARGTAALDVNPFAKEFWNARNDPKQAVKLAKLAFDSSIGTATKKLFLKTLTPEQMRQIFGKYTTSLEEAPQAIVQMEGKKEELLRESQPLSDRWASILRKTPAQNRMVADVMHIATLSGIDPSKNRSSPTLNAMWDALLPETQKLYEDIRDFHADRYEQSRMLLLQRIERVLGKRPDTRDMTPEAATKAVKDWENNLKKTLDGTRKLMEQTKVKGPYFPLARFGRYWIQINKKNDNDFVFDMSETKYEHERKLEEYKRMGHRLGDEGNMKQGESILKQRDRISVMGDLLVNIMQDVDAFASDNAATIESLKDDIYQHYLQTLPEVSMRNAYKHRKGVYGYSSDAYRAFVKSAYHSSTQLARLEFSSKALNAIDGARSAIRGMPNESMLGMVVEELRDRVQYAMGNVTGDEGLEKLTNTLTTGSFYYYLSSASSALLQMFSVPTLSVPTLLGEFSKSGTAKVGKVMSSYSQQILASSATYSDKGKMSFPSYDNVVGKFSDIFAEATKELKKARAEYNLRGLPDDQMWRLDYFKVLESMQDRVPAGKGKGQRDEFLRRLAYEQGITNNVISSTLTADFSTVLRGPSDNIKSEKNILTVANKAATGLFHSMEKTSREITYMAAYDLAISEGMSHTEAVKKATDVSFKALGNFGQTNRPGIMLKPVARMLLQFKRFPLEMAFYLGKNAYDVYAGIKAKSKDASLTPEERKEMIALGKAAKTRLLGTLAATWALAGISGLPGIGGALGVPWIMQQFAMMIGKLGDDEDDIALRKNPETWFRQWLKEQTGSQFVADLINYGPVGTLTNTELSSRLSLNDLLFREPFGSSGTSHVSEAKDWMVQLLGPVASMFLSPAKAWDQWQQGNYDRAVEAIMPSGVRQLMVAWRYADEGVKTPSGKQVFEKEEVSGASIFKQMMGFAPQNIATQTRENIQRTGIGLEIGRARTDLMKKYDRAVLEGKDLDAIFAKIDEHNDKYFMYSITGKDLKGSLKRYSENIDESQRGLSITKKLRSALLPEEEE